MNMREAVLCGALLVSGSDAKVGCIDSRDQYADQVKSEQIVLNPDSGLEKELEK